MLIELANKTIVALRLPPSKLFYGKFMERVFQEEKNLLTPIIRLIELRILQDMQHRQNQLSIPHITLLQFRLFKAMEVKVNGYEARRLQMPALWQDFLHERRA